MEINEKIPITSYMYKFGKQTSSSRKSQRAADLAHALQHRSRSAGVLGQARDA